MSRGTIERAASVLRGPAALWVLIALLLPVGCAALSDRGQPLVPTRHQVRSGPFVIFSNQPTPDDAPAIRCLQALERDLKQHLDYQPRVDDDPVEIYVLDDRNAFIHFLKFYYPELPPRRAFFISQGEHRVVYTYTSPRLEEDLRHEATHALVRGSFGDLPLWLDEGLSEYFEMDLVHPALQRERVNHVVADLASGWSPDLRRLEALADIRDMTPRDYREAWAWVHLFLSDVPAGKARFIRCLVEFREKPDKLLLAQRLVSGGATNDRLLAHIKACESRLPTAEPSSADRSIRLQEKGAESPPPKVSSRGLFERIRAWIGL